MNLWLVRHAQPMVTPGTCYGQLDVPADADATRDSAQELAKVLPAIISVAVSPLQRCEQLARNLRGLRPDLSCKTDARLQEMNFGRWEGQAWADIPRTELDGWASSFDSYAAGQTGESVTQFMARVASAFDTLPHDADTLWITHAGVIRAVELITRGVRRIDRADQWPASAPACGQWCKLSL
ncbi:histidine phosphatase family protein [Polaromonas sp.]|uniref:histidine phosphatase family protein n=1 Tax=Polaromonas sp. TaxID=1869339 RepID=UPI003BAB7A7A